MSRISIVVVSTASETGTPRKLKSKTKMSNKLRDDELLRTLS